jgi:NAD-dependent dihydropyrimidine dehydrogenase PreA subunit
MCSPHEEVVPTHIQIYCASLCLPLEAASYDVDEAVRAKMVVMDGTFQCTDCTYSSRWENCLKIHVESKHVHTGGFACALCEKVCPTRNALKVHCQRRHPSPKFLPMGQQ